jgi:hypothetical protein
MRIAVLDPAGDIQPFVGRLHQFTAGNRCVEWGRGSKPARIQLHFHRPPPIIQRGEGLVELNQAHIFTKNRNLVIAEQYRGLHDDSWMLAFEIRLPSGYRGKPVLNPTSAHGLACDHPTPRPHGFDITGLLILRTGEEVRVDTLDAAGEPSHFKIHAKRGASAPLILRHKGFHSRPASAAIEPPSMRECDPRPLFKAVPRTMPPLPA